VAARTEDPATAAMRRLDWQSLIASPIALPRAVLACWFKAQI